MTSAPLNLNRARKLRARSEAKKKADENSARFGRTKAQEKIVSADNARSKLHLDAHRKDTK